MSTFRFLYLSLLGVLGLFAFEPVHAADQSLNDAIKAADAKYLDAPESGSIDDSPKIVAGGGEEGGPPTEDEVSLGPLRVTLTYVEEEPQAATRSLADDLPGEADDRIVPPSDEPEDDAFSLDDIPEDAMLPGEFDLGETEPKAPVVTVYFDDPAKPAATDRAEIPADADEEAQETPPPGPKVVARLKGESLGTANPPVSIQIAELDPSNPYPEVVVSFFTGGAHCCSVTHVITSTDGAEWRTIDVGEFDGGPMLAVDLDGNGTYEFETRDNAFLYAFACYACSQAPLQVLALRDGKIEDISAEPRFKPAHKAWLKEMIVGVPEQDVNGFLAGYVGQKIRLGEGRQAWDLMLKYYDRRSDWGLEVCDTDLDESGECPGETKTIAFPEALERMLNKNGYKIGG